MGEKGVPGVIERRVRSLSLTDMCNVQLAEWYISVSGSPFFSRTNRQQKQAGRGCEEVRERGEERWPDFVFPNSKAMRFNQQQQLFFCFLRYKIGLDSEKSACTQRSRRAGRMFAAYVIDR